MKNLLIGVIVMSILVGCLSWGAAFAQPSKDYLVATLDILVGEALQAYNSEDYIKFFEYFSKEMSPVTTKQYFKALYINGYKRDLGEFHLRELIENDSSLDPDFPMMVYKGQFAKCDDARIVVNFAREYDNYRIKRIRIDRILRYE
ncbi:MAG: hypothetical protein K9L86_01635 [Candidatus Omnitrophica bacterium]|nr:hypothetical protein [Candidatus Omnitrophota bacterium]